MNARTALTFTLVGLTHLACAKKGELNFSSGGDGLGSPAAPFSCRSPGQPGSTDVLRLTKYELTNTLIDIFGTAIVNDVSTRLGAIPNENVVSGYDSIERRVSAPYIQALFDLSNSLAAQTVATTARQNLIAGACFQDTALTDACLTNFVRSMGLKTFRRPLTAEEVIDYKTFYNASASTRQEGIMMVVARLLQSPNFIYRLENEGALASTAVLELTPYELASRLSYTLWGTMPDPELFAAAADRTILSDEGLKKQATRLLSSARAKSHVRNFYSQWLKMNDTYSISYSSQFLGGISTAGLVEAVKTEAQTFVEHVIWGKNGDVSELLTSNESFVVDSRLASIYGVSPWTAGAPPVSLPSEERSGILTRAAFLISGDDETHPFRRGSTVLSRFLCYEPSRPDSTKLPDGALDEPEVDPGLSTRHRFEIKTSPQMCMGCHSQINPFSFALENFDGLGRHRTIEQIRDPVSHEIVNTVPVDANANYTFSHTGTRSFTGGVQMSAQLAGSGTADVCFVRQWYRYSRAKLDTVEDHCAMNPLLAELSSEGGSILKVIEKSVLDRPFRLRRLKQ